MNEISDSSRCGTALGVFGEESGVEVGKDGPNNVHAELSILVDGDIPSTYHAGKT